MLKKLLIIVFTWLCAITGMAQNLEIKQNFKISENSSAVVMYHNQFGDYEKPAMDDTFPYAVVRVLLEGNAHEVTEAKKMLGIYTGVLSQGVKATYLDFENEILFLVPSSSGHVELSCGEGCVRQTILELPRLQSNAVYVGKVHYTPMVGLIPTGSTQAAKRQYFTFQVTPANATVQVLEDGQWELWEKEDGVFSKSLYYGTYSYKVSADRFQTEQGTIALNDTCKEKVVKLLPDYGWLTIESSTVSKGASVFITSKQMSEPKFIGTIPLTNKELDKGEYVLQVQQTKYKKYQQNITIHPNKTTTLAPELSPNFVSLTLSTDSESEIYVDGKRYAKGSWTGTLELGEYSIEARKQYHRSTIKIVHITDDHANQTIEIDSPQPIYGSLHVKGSPSKASVYVDGEMVGTSPLIVNDLLIGEHEVKVEKDGCAVWKKTVTVADNEECIAQYELEKGVSLERIVLKGMNATNLSVKRAGDETLLFTYDLPKKGPVRLRMSTDGYTYTTQKNVQGDVGKEMDKGKQHQITWTIPKDLGRTMKDSLYFQIVALPEFPKGEIKIGSLYYEATDNGTSVEVARPYDYKKRTYFKYKFKKVAIPAEINYKGYKYSVTSIGSSAFYACDKLTSITIPNSVTSIGENAFFSCDYLTSVTIPNSVTSIGASAFSCCYNLTSITIPNTVTNIGDDAFYYTPWYSNYAKGKDVVYIGKVLYKHNNFNLTSVVVKEGTMSITSYAFRGCKSLQSISIPNSVRYIDNTALNNCSSLTKIIVADGNPWLDSRDNCNAIIETKTNTLLVGCKNTVIPNSVTSIGNYAFANCSNLTSITIPNSVTSIGNYAFSGCNNLSEINLPTGMEDKFNKMEGIKHFYKERDKKYSDGWDYYYGQNGVKQDYTKAVSYFRIAATQGHAAAQNSLGNRYYNGEGVDKNYTEAVKWYRKAAEQGEKHGQYNLGNCYYNGEGVEQNYKEAVKWYRKAADQGHQYAQNNLGNCYYDGEGVDKNYTEAVKWYRKAAEQGYGNAQNHLGNCYYNGKGVDKDYTEAVKWFRKAAEQGHKYAQYNLGLCYQHGNGVTKNLTEAKKWYQKAADQGHEDAKKQLANIQKEETEKAYTDGYNYYHGQNGVKQDYTKAVSYFRIAATQGHAAAQNFLGVCYDQGLGVNEDDVEAVKWFRKAAEQGDKYGQYNLGLCYQYGKGVTKNLTEAKKWYQQAADQGYEYAQNNLGDQYYKGEGVEQNYAEAVKWFRKAAEQGYKYAQFNLGLCYQYGNGVTKDLTEAKKWYRKAADQGHENAKKKLKELQ